MTRRKNLLALIGTLILLLSLSVPMMQCAPEEAVEEEEVEMAEKEPIKIGYPAPLTGMFSADGQTMYEGTMMAVKHINEHGGVLGRPIEAVFYDIEDGAAEKVEGAATKFCLEEKVDAIICSWCSAGADVAAFGKYDVPYLNFDVSSVVIDMVRENPEYSNCFHMGDGPVGFGRKQFSQWMLLPVEWPNHKIAVIHSDFELDIELAEGIMSGAEEYGWEVVLKEEVPFGVMEWRPLLTKIRELKPAIVHMEVESPSDMVVFHRQWMEDPPTSMEMQGYGYSIPGFRSVLLEEGNGVVGQTFCAPFWGPWSGLLWKEYADMWKKEPPLATLACGYSGFFIWKAAVERVGDPKDHKAVCEAIEKYPVMTIKAIYDFDRPGHYHPAGPDLPMMCLQTQEGQYTWLYADMAPCVGAYGPFSAGVFILPEWLDPEEWLSPAEIARQEPLRWMVDIPGYERK